ncbi:hypothetical protein P8452_21767 [Trifolium repens]|nr:hypothetical protein P8452_21767 [Trifolium repens]
MVKKQSKVELIRKKEETMGPILTSSCITWILKLEMLQMEGVILRAQNWIYKTPDIIAIVELILSWNRKNNGYIILHPMERRKFCVRHIIGSSLVGKERVVFSICFGHFGVYRLLYLTYSLALMMRMPIMITWFVPWVMILPCPPLQTHKQSLRNQMLEVERWICLIQLGCLTSKAIGKRYADLDEVHVAAPK